MKPNPKSFAQIFTEAQKHLAFHVEGAILEFTEELCRLLEKQGVTKAELARRLQCQPAYITKLLSGQNNFTLETMVKLARALEAEIKIHLQGPGMESQWVDLQIMVYPSKVESSHYQTGMTETSYHFQKFISSPQEGAAINRAAYAELAFAA